MVDDQAGKGDKYRPIDHNKWDEGWKKAFGKTKKVKRKKTKCTQSKKS